MKDYKTQVTETQANSIVDFFASHGCNSIITKEGCLQDNYCLDIGEKADKIEVYRAAEMGCIVKLIK